MKTIIEKDKSLELEQLHEAITDFQSTVDKLKHFQRLDNYHKHYMSQVKTKARSIQASHLFKVHELIPPGIGTEHNFHMYSFFLLQSQKHRISLPIIETLSIPDASSIFYLHNTALGTIRSNSVNSIPEEFLSKLESSKQDSFPKVIFKSKSGRKRLFFTLSDFTNNWETIKRETGWVQRFVQTREDRVFIFRVHWKEGGIKGYVIGKNRKVSRKEVNKKSLEKKVSIDDEGYLEKAKDILQQIRIKGNRQFSMFSTESFVPNKRFEDEYSIEKQEFIENDEKNLAGSLKEKLERKFSLPWDDEKDDINTYFVCEEPEDNFLVTGRNPDHSYFDEVRKIDKDLVLVTVKVVKLLKRENNNIKEITLDFIKDQDKKWLLLKCEKMLLREDVKRFKEIDIPVSHHKSINAGSRNMSISLIESNANVETKTNTVETPLISEVTIEDLERRPKKNLVNSLKITRSQCFNERYKRVMQRLEALPGTNYPGVASDSNEMIKIYESSFSCSNISQPSKKKLCKQESFKIGVSESYPEDSDISSKSLKSIIHDYDQMMIHVRRLNLEKKKPLLDSYGGEYFWTRVLKSLYKDLIENPFLQSCFSNVTKDQFKNISKGLQCIFNSSMPIEFRRLVRTSHKHLSITSKEFYTFRNIFLQVLKNSKVSKQHLEIIQDNLNSFYSAIVKVP